LGGILAVDLEAVGTERILRIVASNGQRALQD
jgi:hypothetical protein